MEKFVGVISEAAESLGGRILAALLDDHRDDGMVSGGSALLRKAHTAAIERCVSALTRRNVLDPAAIQRLILRDLPDGKNKTALLRCRYALGLSMCPNSRVLVDGDGRPVPAEELPMI